MRLGRRGLGQPVKSRTGAVRTRVLWAVTVLWLVVAGVSSVFAAGLPGLQRDDATIFSPDNGEALGVQQRLQGRTPPSEPAVILWVRPAGINAADTAAASSEAEQMADVAGAVGPVPAPQLSADGQALQVVVPVRRTTQAEAADAVADLRAIISPRSDGLETSIAGPAALDADFAAVLTSVDLRLLATAGALVVLILGLVYRSPVLWLAPVLAVLAGLALAQAVVYQVADRTGFGIDAQSASILLVLGFGAGTDYSLLVIARLREELVHEPLARRAVVRALRYSAPVVLASAATVVGALLCLLASSVQATRALGLTCAIAVVCCALSTLTFLPALLALGGRWTFWPTRPVLGDVPSPGRGWSRWSSALARSPVRASVIAVLVLLVLATGVTQLRASGIAQTDAFVGSVEATRGQQVLEAHFPGGAGSPTLVVVDPEHVDEVERAVTSVPGVARVEQAGRAPDGASVLAATSTAAPDGEDALRTVAAVRAATAGVPGARALVGGESATYLDQQQANAHDRDVVIPLVLGVVLLVLVALLRSVVAPLVLLATVVLSYLATLGVSAWVFNHVLGFAGADPSYPLFVFVFLVALGVDYNIFLAARVRQEAATHGSRHGVLRGLTATGSVITSSGLVLAATFATLGVLPLVFFATVGFSVAFGVLLDTLLVRSVLVPGLALLFGDAFWWPRPRAGQHWNSQPAADQPRLSRPKPPHLGPERSR